MSASIQANMLPDSFSGLTFPDRSWPALRFRTGPMTQGSLSVAAWCTCCKAAAIARMGPSPGLTPDLKECGTAAVPYLSSLAFSPDRSLLYAAGFQSGLAVLDAASLEPRQRLRQKSGFFLPICDGQNRLWVGNGGFFECYTPTLELISRHRLAGGIHDIWPGPDGSVCVLTFQDRKDLSRVYRFS